MKEVFDFVKDIFIKIVGEKISPIQGEASAIILFVIVVSCIGLLALAIWLYRPRPPEQGITVKNETDINILKRTVDVLNDRLEKSAVNPEFTTLEKIYFAVNGITNSATLLSVSILLWEFQNLRGKGGQLSMSSIANEIGQIMGALVFTFVLSALVVCLMPAGSGRSYQRINRAFVVSFVIGVATFGIFYFVVRHYPVNFA